MTKDEFLAAANKLKRNPDAHNQLCVNYINAYWRETHGQEVNARVEIQLEPLFGNSGHFLQRPVVKSDTHNGLPNEAGASEA